nr:hypothetical protein [Tanacetum cinerariifolium]
LCLCHLRGNTKAKGECQKENRSTVVAAPRLTAATKGKQPARATSPTDPSGVERTKAEQLKIVLRRSRQETHISQQGGSSTDEGTESGGDDEETKSDRESEEEETREKEEESFDPIPKTPEDSEDDNNGEEDQGLRISEEERMHEEEEADELYRDVDIKKGRGLQVSQDIEDSQVTLTPVHSDGQQESSSTSSFVTSLLNPIIDPGMESIFTTASSSVAPLPSPTSTMTPSIMTTTTIASQPPIPSTPIPNRVKSLEVNFLEFMRTNQSSEAISNIMGIVHQYMHQEMTKAVREAVQIQTDRLQDSLQRENDEFLITIDDNMKKIIKKQVKSQVKAQVITRSSHSSRTSYDVAADLAQRLRIGRSNFRLPLDIQSKESILQVIKTLTDVDVNKPFQPWRSFAEVINKCPTGKSSGFDSLRKKRGGSDSSTTPPTPISTPTPITTVVAAPRLIAAAKGKQPARATSPTDPSEVERTEAEQLKILLRRSRQETYISQHGGFSTDEGIGSKPGVPDVPSNDSEEEISWNSSDDEDVNAQDKDIDDDEGKKNDESNDGKDDDDANDDEEEIAKIENQSIHRVVGMMKKLKVMGRVRKKKQGKRKRRVLIQFLELLKTVRMMAMVRRIKGRGLQVSQDIEDSHVTLTPVHSDGQQESSSTSSFVTSLLNPIIDPSMESIFTTASSSVAPLPSPTSTMTPSFITTTTTASQPPIPPTPIPSEVFQNLSTFESVFRFEDRVKSLEVNFSEFMRTNQFPEAVSNIPEEPVQTTCQMDEPSHLVFERGAKDQPIVQTSQHPEWFSQPRKPPTPNRDWNKTLPAVQGSAQSWISELKKQADVRSSFNELLDTPIDFSNFIMNQLGVDTLTPELLAGLTYELMRGSCNSLTELEYHLEEEPIIYDKHVLWGVSHWGRKRQQFYGFAVNRESALYVYSKRRIIVVTDLKIMEWHNYKHLDWISRRVEDLQLGVESYQKRLNLTKPDTYRSDLKRREAYTAYSYPRGFIYQNKDKKNRKGEKDRAAAMIQAIDKMLKTRRIMRSLEKVCWWKTV